MVLTKNPANNLALSEGEGAGKVGAFRFTVVVVASFRQTRNIRQSSGGFGPATSRNAGFET